MLPVFFYNAIHNDFFIRDEYYIKKHNTFEDQRSQLEALKKKLKVAGEFKEIMPWRIRKSDCRIHKYVKMLEKRCNNLQKEDEVFPHIFLQEKCYDSFTPLHQNTLAMAENSLNLALNAAEHVMAGKSNTAYALCRPGGHHAGIHYYGGYCYLNNAAIAANRAVKKGFRPLIFDFDFHHGNGTQEIFYNSDQVMVLSLHGSPDTTYPYYCGYSDETGSRKGQGFNKNIEIHANDTQAQIMNYLTDIHQFISQYKPDLLICSCGYSFHKDGLYIHPDIDENYYYALGKVLSSFKMPKLFIQEGGCMTKNGAKSGQQLILGLKGG